MREQTALAEKAAGLVETVERSMEKHSEFLPYLQDLVGALRTFADKDVSGGALGLFISKLIHSQMSMSKLLGMDMFTQIWNNFLENPTRKSLGLLTPFVDLERDRLYCIFAALGNVDLEDAKEKLLFSLDKSEAATVEAQEILKILFLMDPDSDLFDKLSGV